MINYITYKNYVKLLVLKLLVLRLIMGVFVNVVIEQNLYEVVGKHILLNLAIRRVFYRFLLQRILWYVVVFKTPICLVQLILLLISRTSKVTIVGKENLEVSDKGNIIFAFWHGNYTLLLTSLRMSNRVVLVHWSFRGNYIAQLFSTFNYRIVRTSKSGKSILKLIKVVKQGCSLFIAVDGPQGPAYKTKPGIIYIAQKTGAKIVPLRIEGRKGFILKKRWDNHFIPFPFNNITVSFGKSISVKPGDSLETKEEEVTRALLGLTRKKIRDLPN